jgi:urea carboxylase
MFDKVLVANRGEIALRIQRSLRAMGLSSVAVYSDADAQSPHRFGADEAFRVGPGPAPESYLNVPALLAAAKMSGAGAVHPGYGFLSENADFAEACEAAGLAFIGPTPANMRDFGLKHSARELAAASGVPMLPGSGLLDDVEHAAAEAARIGYPIMLKSTAGGGGIGMSVCRNESELREAFDRIARLGANNFKHAGMFAEKYVERGRHVEVQIFGDGKGKALALGERDCSTQRRNQKVIEETPAPGLTPETRAALFAASVRLAEAGKYRSAGTVEYIYDEAAGAFYFLEVNTRLQVEHGVTEAVTGIDLVEWMVRLADGSLPDLSTLKVQAKGCAMQVRVYAEDPARDFRPSSGLLTEVCLPEGVRVDAWISRGTVVPPFYDPLLAKIIVRADDRASVLAGMRAALDITRLRGIETNAAYLRQILDLPDFRDGRVHVKMLADFSYRANAIEVLKPGTQTSVQDVPGRLGYWMVGVPPSGPMDPLNFRLANRLLGNPDDAAGLECTVNGPTLLFHAPTHVCLTGADMGATLNGAPVERYAVIPVKAGDKLALGMAKGAGQRAYLAVAGGFDVPAYLGSRSTFMLGQFGGHGGRTLQTGDMLPLHAGAAASPRTLPAVAIPPLTRRWEIGVLYGPHGSPDFFTDRDIETLFATDWEVHFNSDRTGVRLIGPKPEWARADGGEAGLHPSNIHDNAYAVGTIDFTGDMPIILGPDGPSLGGFVCPATLVAAEIWKMGQLKPGDKVRFVRLSQSEAEAAEEAQENFLRKLDRFPSPKVSGQGAHAPAILAEFPADDPMDRVVCRRSGDKYLLVEFGPLELDLNLRFRAHALMTHLEGMALEGVIDLTPGIRSLQIHYDNRRLPLMALLEILENAVAALPDVDALKVPSRIVHLPLSWDDEATHEAILKYMQSVRPDAPWCPSNIEFIRRINGLPDIQDVKAIVFGASYLVMGLGDVYLGAPVATPLDPRHRLVTTKYNPARTWTAENSVGIGGAYLCVYGMEGPGGYQFVGRTLQMWNRYQVTPLFPEGKPWLLRFFDQIRFYPVSHAELIRIRADFPHGAFTPKVEETVLDLHAYHGFLKENRESIRAFKEKQQAAFEEERARWEAAGQASFVAEPEVSVPETGRELPPGCAPVLSPVAGSVWKILAKIGQAVRAGDPLVIVESMKMEITVTAETDGTVEALYAELGAPVKADQVLLALALNKGNP